ncbi:EAL domain-containing protein [Corallincola luteus]|uniref:EAL domain-containing protein n=1 Tax=Corallincola luteus TaxID=1775177 RepID=A0ABY2AJ86_9GAMM|nr:EAL domain-containing protein [Corallincola luteus]
MKINSLYSRFFCRCARSILCTCVCLLAIVSHSLTAKPVVSDPRFSQLTITDGLSQSSVNAVLIDRNGFLWIGTHWGLNRYDGYKVSPLNRQHNILNKASIYALFEDDAGLIWISTGWEGIYSIDPATSEMKQRIAIKSRSFDEPLQSSEFITQGPDGKIWVVLDESIVSYDKETEQITTVFALSDAEVAVQQHVRTMAFWQGEILVGTSTGLYLLDRLTQKLTLLTHLRPDSRTLDADNTKALYVAEDDSLYIGTVDGLFRLSAQQVAALIKSPETELYSTPLIDGRNIWKIVVSGETIYLPTDEGVFRFIPSTQTAEQIFLPSDAPYGISSDQLYDLTVDDEGNLWLGSDAAGALYWQTANDLFSNRHSLNSELSHDAVWSLYLQDETTLWLGSDNGLNRYRLDTDEITAYLVDEDHKSVESSGSIYQILSAGDIQLWLYTPQGLYLFDMETGQAEPLTDLVPESRAIFAMDTWGYYQAPDDTIWFVGEEAFYRFDPLANSIVEHQLFDVGELKPELVWGFLGQLPGDDNGVLVSATHSLWRLDIETGETRKLHSISRARAQRYVYPESWVVDRNNTLWVTYPGAGLVGLDSISFEEKFLYDQTNRLPANEVYGLQLDGRGDLWLSSLKGILKINVDNHHLRHYSYNHGLATEEFNEFSAVQLADGRIAYGSYKGVTLFEPNQLTSHARVHPPRIAISNIELLSRDLSMPLTNLNGARIDLAHNDVGLSIEFSGLTFSEQNNLRFQYELTGGKDISYPLTRDNRATFATLNPGQYQFRVWAYSADSGERGEMATIDIVVAYPPWASPGAYFGYAVLLITLLLLVWRRHRLHQSQIAQAHEATKQSEQRMQLALTGSDSGIWEWDEQQNCFVQNRFEALLGYQVPVALTLDELLHFIHPSDQQRFKAAWQIFVYGDNTTFDVSYRLRHQQGHYLYFRDLGSLVTRDQTSRIIGTYTDVTDIYSTKERASLFGRIFEHSHEWVMVLNKHFRVIDANPALRAIIGSRSEEDFPEKLAELLALNPDGKRLILAQIRKLSFGEQWNGELAFVAPSGQRYEVEVDLYSVASGDSLSPEHYAITLSDITEQKRVQAQLKKMASFDGLTGLPNRMLFLDRLSHAIDQAERAATSLAVMFIDLDKFKQINDSLGHDAGDALLCHVATQVTQCLRKEDTVARLSGDEFVVMLENIDANEASRVANTLNQVIQQPLQLGAEAISVGSSIGIAMYPMDGRRGDELIKHADIAMYHAKNARAFSVQFYQTEMNHQVRERLSLANGLKDAVKDKAFSCCYQPIIDFSSGKVIALELLMRWQRDGVAVSPMTFIPIAEEMGLIGEMTWQALHLGLTDLRHWYQLGYQPRLSLNLSARHFDVEGLTQELVSLMADYALPCSALSLEITEGALMSDHVRAQAMMNRLNEAGFTLALDDFGTGYSSLKYLQAFPIDILKIDRSFVSEIGVSDSAEGIINATLKLAEILNMQCIAEGIETREQALFFAERGCDWLQGYYFSRPVIAENVPALLASSLPSALDS